MLGASGAERCRGFWGLVCLSLVAAVLNDVKEGVPPPETLRDG